ncbi:hypothetical protein [Paraburkholderia fungorum]|uniref:hypothetical protein n=1 Tax=Paraburkholderia fungorum TaxID=134537 RepID=UPI000FDABB74|nr:hypothetical protein [Paraburkholderia fungorum]
MSSDTTIGPYNWCFLQTFDNPQADGTGLWEVAIASDGGPNNRYFFLHNSKAVGRLLAICVCKGEEAANSADDEPSTVMGLK